MLYFAYGSNMSLRRLRQRTPSAEPIDQVALRGHRLAFHKIGRDGSAKCDIIVVDDPDSRVHGVLYRIDVHDRAALDAAEGLGRGYEVRNVEVTSAGGEIANAFTYYATATDATLRPYAWYVQHVLRGARENGLPAHYVAEIATVDTVDDPNSARAAAELAIHGLAPG